MDLFHIKQSYPFHPSEISNFLCENAPKSLTRIGNPNILKHKKLALLSSVKCPGNLILKTHDFVHHLLENDIAIISGFEFPLKGGKQLMNRDCF